MADDTAYRWSSAFDRARELGYSAEVKVPKSAEPLPPATLKLRESPPPYSIKKGAEIVYRQDKEGDHFQIREYEEYWTVDLDRFNPHHAPVRHAVADASKYTAAAVGMTAIAIGGLPEGDGGIGEE